MKCPQCDSEKVRFLKLAGEYICDDPETGCRKLFSETEFRKAREEIRSLNLELPFVFAE